MKLYFIPGVAADRRIFQKLEFPDHDQIHLELPHMNAGATMVQFAEALSGRIDRNVPHVLIGMSMGGMIAQELAALSRPTKVIIISSWKGPSEMPRFITAMRGTHPERVVSHKFIDRILPLLYWQMGAESDDDRALIDSFLHATPIDQIKAQLNASLNWNGPLSAVKKITHIHGDGDHLMPISDIKGAIPVKDGGHIMVFNKAAEVSRLINQELPTTA